MNKHIAFYTLALGVIMFLLTSCMSTDRRVEQLLTEAGQAIDRQRLTIPRHDNAHQRYLQVLALDPGNEQAMDGINIIVEQYLSWAMSAADHERHAAADDYLRLARLVNAEHPKIMPAQQKIDQQRQGRVRVFTLDQQQVKQRHLGSDLLDAIVAEIIKGDTFVIIRAPEDASGRWLYQQLNNKTANRVKASMEIGSPPAVTVTR